MKIMITAILILIVSTVNSQVVDTLQTGVMWRDTNGISYTLDRPTIISSKNGVGKTYYVSNDGNDSNSGLLTSEPFKTVEKVNSMSLKPGDQILFKRGDIWNEFLTVTHSGVENNPIVYGVYGSGDKPLFSISDTSSYYVLKIEGEDYIYINNLHFRNSNAHNIVVTDTSSFITIENCISDSATYQGIQIEDKSNNFTIANNIIQNNYVDGIYLVGCHHGEIYGNEIINNGLGEQYDRQAIGLWHSNNISIYNNNISHHGAGSGHCIEMTANYFDNINIKFYNNIIQYTGNGRTLSLFRGKYDVYYNTIIADSAKYILFTGDINSKTILNYYNNTSIGGATSVCLYEENYKPPRVTTESEFRVKNNIFVNDSLCFMNVCPGIVDSSIVEIDNNIYSNNIGTKFRWWSNTWYNFADWKTNSNRDANSLVGDPLFDGEDYFLQTGSPAINAGTDIGLTTDINGNPIVGNPDIGAYEKQE